MGPVPRPKAPLPDNELWFGANFWSRLGGPLMWRHFDDAIVSAELAVLAANGVTLTRSFMYWPDFQPEPFRLDEACLHRFGRFLDLHLEHGMTTLPTMIVGHMSGENWDPVWRAGRDLYRDVWMVDRQAWYLRSVAQRFAAHPAVAGWLVSNEMPNYGGGGGIWGQDAGGVAAAEVYAWGDLMAQALRAGGATQPISLGDGAWGIDTTGVDNGYHLRDLIDFEDFAGPHTYPMGDDPVRQNLNAAFVAELCAMGKPVVMEEFGLTSDFADQDNAAHYYRQTLYTTALAGAVGWIGWNNTDFDLPGQDPYRHHPFEQHFGLTTVDGTPKRALEEFALFRAFADRAGLATMTRTPSHTAILISSFLDQPYPFVNQGDRSVIRDIGHQAYVSAKLADLAPAVIREADGLPTPRLIIVPATKALLATTLPALEAAAAAGTTVYYSYFGGEWPNQRGSWLAGFDALFGVRRIMRYGLAEPPASEVLTWRFLQPLGDLAESDELTVKVAGTADGRGVALVEAREADVVAVDQTGRPAVLVRPVGKGRIVLVTAPLEYYEARLPHVNPAPSARLYQALGQVAGVAGLAGTDTLDAFAEVMAGANGQMTGFVVSESPEPRAVTAWFAASPGGEPQAVDLELDAYGVVSLSI
ncbi:MAG: cellulase family glycosylhydrolase [Bifidobacteriaceae bacterium]|nr:cellulase family glycosylhydrolase [Bifidobacteriaceae bacterium]